MKIKYCKKCKTEDNLKFIKDFKYQSEREDPIKIIDVIKCSLCGTIHWETDTHDCWEFISDRNNEDGNKSVEGWATSHN